MRNYLMINGVSSADFGVYISGPGTFSAPAREVQMLQIPGRNGDLIVKADRLQNYELVYPAFICRNFDSNIAALRNYLLSQPSYLRLEDSYHPDEFRVGVYTGPFDPEVTQRLRAAKFDLSFNVKPQRFLKSGEVYLTFTGTSPILENPTLFDAKPILRLQGNGTFRINTLNYYTVQNNENETITIDCELMECYTGATARNADVLYTGTDTPVLKPGQNRLLFTDFEEVQLMPRWWTV